MVVDVTVTQGPGGKQFSSNGAVTQYRAPIAHSSATMTTAHN